MELKNSSMLQYIFKNFSPKKPILILSCLLTIGGSIVGLIIPLIFRDVLDQMTLTRVTAQIIIIGVSIFLVNIVLSSVSLYMMNYISQYIVANLRKKLWHIVIQLPIKYFDEHTSGEIMSRVTNDTAQIKGFIENELVSAITGIITIVGGVIMLFLIDWKITLVMGVGLILIVGLVTPLAKKEYSISVATQDETAKLQSDLGRVLSDIRLVKVSLAEKQEIRNGNKRIDKLFGYGIKEGKIMALIDPFMQTILMGVLLVIFAYGVIRVSQNTLSTGSLVAIISYLFQLINPCSQLTGYFAEYHKFLGTCNSIKEILNKEIEFQKETFLNANQKLAGNDLIFSEVSFGYDSQHTVIDNLNFKAQLGEVTAIVGPSGGGKTTIFSLIERFYHHDKGKITFAGVPIENYQIEDWRKKIGYVTQESPIMSGTILSNLVYGLDEYDLCKIEEAIDSVGLRNFIDSLPEGYHTQVGERGINLSGGQRQRLAIARAMIRNPEILLLDEATAHLDSTTEMQVQESLNVLMKGRTTLIIAHRLSTVKNADNIIVYENGKVNIQGTHDHLMKSSELYRKMVKQQMLTA